jgi:hypothetical protein
VTLVLIEDPIIGVVEIETLNIRVSRLPKISYGGYVNMAQAFEALQCFSICCFDVELRSTVMFWHQQSMLAYQ